MSYEPIASADHADRGPLRLLEQFKEKPLLEALLRSYLTQIQNVEDCAWEVIYARNIETGVGDQLDKIGEIVGRERLGLEDDEYRLAIRCQIRINRSSGKPTDIQVITEMTLDDAWTFEYREFYPARIQITIVELVTFSLRLLLDNLRAAKMGGVALDIVYSTELPEESFTLAPSTSYVIDEDLGFGSTTTPATGGYLATVTGV
jgi:hypothetical protein